MPSVLKKNKKIMDLRKKNLIFADSFLDHLSYSDCQSSRISDTVTAYLGKVDIIPPGIETFTEEVRRTMKDSIKEDFDEVLDIIKNDIEDDFDEIMDIISSYNDELNRSMEQRYEAFLSKLANAYSKTLIIVKQEGDSIKVLGSTCYPGPEGDINEIFILDNTEITNLLNSRVFSQDKIKGNTELLAIKLHKGFIEMFGEDMGFYLDGILDNLD